MLFWPACSRIWLSRTHVLSKALTARAPRRYIRLINVNTYELEDFHTEHQVKYAILSHRWEQEEILYKDFTGDYGDSMKCLKGWYKIAKCCEQAAKDGLKYCWVDTCCIDKNSSAELQEAINSMYRWYQAAQCCYAFLSDLHPVEHIQVGIGAFARPGQNDFSTPAAVHIPDRLREMWAQRGRLIQGLEAFARSRWFRRGWTLQELLAPKVVKFYDSDWVEFGSRSTLASEIEHITGIPRHFLLDGFGMQSERIAVEPSIAEVMSWAAKRQTTRVEDKAYSLLGLFEVSMPLLYGEGNNAFVRLQQEILKKSDDQSIFAWDGVGSPGIKLLSSRNSDGSWFAPSATESWSPGLLARSPDAFVPGLFRGSIRVHRRRPHAVTNEGITLDVKLISYAPRLYIALLNIQSLVSREVDFSERSPGFVGIFVKRLDADGRYARIPGPVAGGRTTADIVIHPSNIETRTVQRQITVVRRLRFHDAQIYNDEEHCGFKLIKLPGLPPDYPAQSRSGQLCWSTEGAAYHPRTQVLTPRVEPSSTRSSTQEDWLASAGGLVGIVVFGERQYSPPIFGLAAVGLGFDFDFNPMLVFRITERPYCVDLDFWRDMFESTSAFNESPRYDNDAVTLRVENGTWRVPQYGYFALKTTMSARDSGAGLTAILDLKSSGQPTYSFTIELYRTKPDVPWEFRMIGRW